MWKELKTNDLVVVETSTLRPDIPKSVDTLDFTNLQAVEQCGPLWPGPLFWFEKKGKRYTLESRTYTPGITIPVTYPFDHSALHVSLCFFSVLIHFT